MYNMIQRHLYSWACSVDDDLPNVLAASIVSLDPRMVMIWVRAIRSSLALKNGYLPLSSDSNMTPADHMSIAAERCCFISQNVLLLSVKRIYISFET